MAKPVYINNIACFLPNDAVNNQDMEAILGQAGNRPSRARRIILRNNGIKSRHYAIDPETGLQNFSNAQLSAEAIKRVAHNHLTLEKLDALVFGTSIADQIMPGHAVMVHGELGIPPLEVISTAGICLSGITALKYAYMGIKAGEFKHAVAGASEVASAVMRGSQFEAEIDERIQALEKNPELAFEKDFLRWMLSDGAGAALLETEPNSKGLSLKIEWLESFSYAGEEEACMYAGGEKENGELYSWLSYSPKQRSAQSIMSIKQDVKLLNEKIIYYTVEKTLEKILNKHDLQTEDINWFLPHYSSEFFRDKVYQGLKNINFEIPFEKWFTNLTSKGNTGSASIYVILEEIFHSGKLKPGEKLLCFIPESGRFSSAFMLLTVV